MAFPLGKTPIEVETLDDTHSENALADHWVEAGLRSWQLRGILGVAVHAAIRLPRLGIPIAPGCWISIGYRGQLPLAISIHGAYSVFKDMRRIRALGRARNFVG